MSNNESGQSTVEFALTSILLLAFSFFFIQLSLVMGWGNYVHYATFMAARAYLSAGPSQQDQKDRANEVIIRMLKRGAAQPNTDRIAIIAKGTGGDGNSGVQIDAPDKFSHDTRNFSWLEGVRYTFRSRLFMIPFAGSDKLDSQGQPVNSVTLTAESWLGREPPGDECITHMPQGGVYDNGC